MGSSRKPDKLADLTASLAARKSAAVPAAAADNQTDATVGKDMAVTPSILSDVPVDSLVPNQSISLYESDLNALENIRNWLSIRGLRGCNSSEAIRLCIRFAATEANSEALAALCVVARAKDGRKTRWAKR